MGFEAVERKNAPMQPLAQTPPPPYYAVIFTSKRTAVDEEGYGRTAERMVELARQQPGFLGIDSVRGEDGVGITVAYWTDEAAIAQWREHLEHREAQALGRSKWYEAFQLRVCRVERAYGKEGHG
jgi:heme-degrading monooxygenase HmoA